MIDLYTHPQEIWDAQECHRRSRHAPTNFFGDRPPRGIIACSASTSPMYGQTMRYNGGTIIDGEHYQSERRPLPKIDEAYEFYQLVSWGTCIRKKATKQE